MKRVKVKVRTNPRKFGRATVERIPYLEVEGWACKVAGEPCAVHRTLRDVDGVPVPGGTDRPWSVTHIPSGGKISGGFRGETRARVIERAAQAVEGYGGRAKLLEVAAEVVEREGTI